MSKYNESRGLINTCTLGFADFGVLRPPRKELELATWRIRAPWDGDEPYQLSSPGPTSLPNTRHKSEANLHDLALR